MAVELQIETEDATVSVRLGKATVWSHSSNHPGIAVGDGDAKITSSHGNFRIRPRRSWRRWLRKFQILGATGSEVSIALRDSGGLELRLEFSLESTEVPWVRLAISRISGPDYGRVWLALPALRNEPVFGCGEQFSRFNLRGSRLPLWTGEQGVGRGLNFTTLAANLHSGSGGHWHSTYFPQPSYVTATGRVFHAETSSFAVFDFLKHRDLLEIWEPEFTVFLGAANADSSASADAGDCAGFARGVKLLSNHLGRQPPLPEWTHAGMWLGLQGGSDVIRSKVDKARDAGIPLGGVWVQDWVGRRVTAFGSQLFWDWRYDRTLYPDLPKLTSGLASEGIRFLGYINPFLAIEGELYKEAREKGYCVKNHDGSDAMITVTTFPAAMVDLSNHDAWEWLKRVIRENMLGVGLSGWMADYGEYLPLDVRLANADPALYHNRFPAEWARLNHEAVSDAGKIDDVAIFMRAGYTGSSRHTHAVWAGDQMVDWGKDDGIPSVLPAALSAGVCGIGVHHSDLGGFTSLFRVKRSKELFMRWAEFSAFTPIMRSHESNRPADNWQWDGDPETIRHLARMATVFVTLAPYTRQSLLEHYDFGLPVMRPVSFHYSNVSEMRRPPAYLYGRDVFVCPVTRPGVDRVRVVLPDDEWVHLWTGDRVSGGPATVDAPPGRPPVFYRASSPSTDLFETIAGL